MVIEQLNPRVLGQLLLMQSYINNLPDKRSIFSFVCHGLLDIPGIGNVSFTETDDLVIEPTDNKVVFPMIVSESNYGSLLLTISDSEAYLLYEAYLKNFIFMIGVVLEQRHQQQTIRENQQFLEQRIVERTRELQIEKENLVESNRRFSDLMKNVQLFSVMLDVNGCIIFCNDYLLRLTSYSLDEVLGKTWFDIFLPVEVCEEVKQGFSKSLGCEVVAHFENEIVTKSGERLTVSWNNTLLYDRNQQIIGTASIGENITDRKLSEIELQNKNEEYEALNEELRQTNDELLLSKDKAEENEKYFRSLFENSPVGKSITSLDGKIETNKAFSEMLGYSFDEFQKRDWKEFSHPDDIQKSADVVELLLRGEVDSYQFEKRFIHKSGAIVFAEVRVSLQRSETGEALFFITTIIDVTDRKKAEKAVKRQQQLLSETEKMGNVGGWEFNTLTTKMFWTEETYNIHELDLSHELVVEDGLRFYTESSKPLITELVNRAITFGEPFDVELEIVTAKGNKRNVHTIGQADLENHRVFGFFQDITLRKQAEIDLQKKNEEYESLNEELRQKNEELVVAKLKAEESEAIVKAAMENSQAGIAIAEVPSGALKYVNRAGLLIRDKSYNEVVTDVDIEKYVSSWQILHFDGTPYKIEEVPLARAVMFGETCSEEFIVRRDTLDDRYVWANAAPIYNEQGIQTAAIVVFLDITDKKHAEFALQEKNEAYKALNDELSRVNESLSVAKNKAEESDRLKTSFLQNMSHEIRTPMNAIMGFSSLLMGSFDDKQKLQKYTNIITLRCNDLLDIINDILDISRIESGVLPVNIEECNLYDLFDELTSFFGEYQKRIAKDGITLRLQAHCSRAEGIIMTDKVKLKQIFINLITNAFKFTNTGYIDGGCMLDEHNRLVFYVRDTGIGIPANKQEWVFERFAQLNPDKNSVVSGTGLGLSIVKGLTHLLGGEMRLESEVDKGSRFTFTIKYDVIENVSAVAEYPETTSQLPFSNKCVLVVEDDYYNAEYLKEIFDDLGLHIVHVTTGKEALEAVNRSRVDVILMDIRLPDMNGYDVTRCVKQIFPDMKIIAQTAYASNEERQKARLAGCIDYVSKPTKKEIILEMVNRYLMMD